MLETDGAEMDERNTHESTPQARNFYSRNPEMSLHFENPQTKLSRRASSIPAFTYLNMSSTGLSRQTSVTQNSGPTENLENSALTQ